MKIEFKRKNGTTLIIADRPNEISSDDLKKLVEPKINFDNLRKPFIITAWPMAWFEKFYNEKSN